MSEIDLAVGWGWDFVAVLVVVLNLVLVVNFRIADLGLWVLVTCFPVVGFGFLVDVLSFPAGDWSVIAAISIVGCDDVVLLSNPAGLMISGLRQEAQEPASEVAETRKEKTAATVARKGKTLVE